MHDSRKTLFMTACIVLVITVAFADDHNKIPVDSDQELVDTLCNTHQHELKNNIIVELSAPMYTLLLGNSCLIENIANLTIRGNSSDLPVVIQCSTDDGESNVTATSGFVFVNVHNLTIVNVIFEDCGSFVAKEMLQLGNSSLFHFFEEEIAVLVFRNCSNLNLSNVNITKYFGRAFIGLDVYGHSTINHVTITDNALSHPICYGEDVFAHGHQCKGSGMVWLYTNRTLSENTTVHVDIVNCIFSNNLVVPSDESFTCGQLLADSFYSRDIFSVTHEPIDIPSTGALSFILQQQSPVRVNINKTHLNNNRGVCFGAVLAIYTSKYSYNALLFSECTFSKIVSDRFFPTGRYFGTTVTLLMKYLGEQSVGEDCFTMTDSKFTSTHETFNTSQLVLTQFPANSGTCVAILRNITGKNIRLLNAVSLETGSSSFYVYLSDIRLIGNQEDDRPKLDVGYGLLTFSYITRVVIHGSNNTGTIFSTLSGPIISSEVTNVILTGNVRLDNAVGSWWTSGAAMYLRSEAKIWLQEPLDLTFYNNTALEGGAIYSVSRFAEYCAFQFITRDNRIYNSSNIGDIDINVTFISNRAQRSGNSIYAYPLLSCSHRLSPTIQVESLTIEFYESMFTFIDSSENGLLDMSSKPLWVCLCGEDSTNTSFSALNCYQAEEIETFPGKTFNRSVIPVDELNQPVYSVVYSDLQPVKSNTSDNTTNNNIYWNLGYGESIVSLNGSVCSTVKFTIYSNRSEVSGVINLSPSETINSLKIPFHLKHCPLGFRLVGNKCDCAEVLENKSITCDISKGTVTRPGTSWIGIVPVYVGLNKYDIQVGFALHCPTRYCDQTAQSVNVSDPSSLCHYNRTGVLCGRCKDGLSVTVGSPMCQKCPNWWLWTILLYAILGFIVVVLLLVLQLTVAHGTINGLIFYANLLNVNTYTVILGYSGASWTVVFVSFLNLELGFPVCLFNGLTEIDKALLSVVFPVYILLLAMAFVYANRFSYKLSRLTHRSSIPVLATLIYISYFKFLRFSVSGLTYSIVDTQHPSDSKPYHKIVWYYDGSVEYLQDHKHIVLFLMVLVIVGVFVIPYGVVLTGIQFFGRFRIVNKFKPLVDAYCAPYKDRYRYWFGLRLWVLVALYILFSILRTLPLIYLLCQAIVLTLFTVTQAAIMPFRSTIINCLDLFFMVNALLLTVGVLYTYSLTLVNYPAAISVPFTLVMACCIVGYHTWKPLKACVNIYRMKARQYVPLEETMKKNSSTSVVTESTVNITPTTEVSVQQHHTQPIVYPSKFRDSILEESVLSDNK